MANLEKNNIEDIQEMEDLVGELENFENDLENFYTDVETGLLNEQVEQSKEPERGKFLDGHESRDKNFVVYEYIIKSHGTPAAVRNQAIDQHIATNKTGIQITNGNAIQYSEDHNFKAGDKVYVRVPINYVKAGQFLNKHESKDKNFMLYEYTIKSGGSPKHVRAQAIKKGLATNTDGIQVTDGNAKLYNEAHKFKAGDKVYLRIPKSQNSAENNSNIGVNGTNAGKTGITKEQQNENFYGQENIETQNKSVEIIDGMKCKGGEYFGIDVSRFNNGVGRQKGESDESYKARCEEYWNECYGNFIERNNRKWNSEGQDVRGVSFIYIRAGDGLSSNVTADNESIKNWTNFIKKYNQEDAIRNNHEQIASGFYWTLTNKKGIQTQADNFLKIYNKYKNISGGHNLVPMLDLETNRFTEVKKTHRNKNGKIVIDERYTPQQFRDNALQWLQYVEKKTGVIPGIYIGAKAYGSYIKGDKRFDKYLTRITAYPGSSRKTGREMGTARRINFEEGSVNIGTSSQPIDIKPEMYQSSQEGSVAGASAEVKENDGKKYMDTDMDHTKDITKLFSKNNLSNNAQN